jgi:hypothetical protein
VTVYSAKTIRDVAEPVERQGYELDPELRAALVAPTRRWEFQYEVLAPDDEVKGYVEVESARVQNNDLADDVKRTGEFVVLPNDVSINYLKDRLRVYASLLLPDGTWKSWVLGTFLMSTTSGKRGYVGRPTAVTGYDEALVLHEDRIASRYHVAGGVNYRTAINTILTDAGFTQKAIEATSLTLPGKGEEWKPGTSRLQIVNDLLDAIGYRSLVFDPCGVPTSGEWQSPKQTSPVWTYAVDAESVLRTEPETNIDLHGVPNRWVAFVSEPDRPLLRSVVTNNDPASPTSTVSRGRTITEVLNAPSKMPKKHKKETRKHHRHASQAVLDAYVARVAERAQNTYEQVSFDTGLMPFHMSGDVFLLNWGEGNVRYRETEWSMDLTAGGTMTHIGRRVMGT